MVGISNFSEIKDVSENDPKKLGKLLFDNISNMNRDQRTSSIKYLCANGHEESLSSFMDNLELQKVSAIKASDKIVKIVQDSAVGAEEAAVLMDFGGRSYYRNNSKSNEMENNKEKEFAWGIIFVSMHSYKKLISNDPKNIKAYYNKENFIQDTTKALGPEIQKYIKPQELAKIYDGIVSVSKGNKLGNLVKGVKDSIKKFTTVLKNKVTAQSRAKKRGGKQYQRFD